MFLKKVSLYIPCYNAEAFISRCLDAVMKQAHPFDEVLLIDDGSSDNSVSIALRYSVTVIRHGVNKGLAAARNTGLMHAKNDLVASLDADCTPEPDWLEKLVPHFLDTRVAGAGGRLVETFRSKITDKWRAVHMKQNWGTTITKPHFLYGSNTVFRKEVILSLGGYDERYRTNSEDYEISLKIIAQGHVLMYEPDAVARHLRQDTLKSLLNTYWRWTFYGTDIGTKERRTPCTFYNLCCKVYDNLVYIGIIFFQDIQKVRFDFLAVDFAVLCNNIVRDIEYYCVQKSTAFKKNRLGQHG